MTVNVVQDDDRVFIAHCVDLDVWSEGTSLPDALRALAEAIEIVEDHDPWMDEPLTPEEAAIVAKRSADELIPLEDT